MEIIHIVLGKANPNRMNGVNRVIHQLATQQVLAGRQVSVWGITKDPVHNYPERNFNTVLFKSNRPSWRLHQTLVTAIANARAGTVFHLHGGFNPVFHSVARLLHRKQHKFVFTPHGAYNIIAMKKTSLIKKLYLRLFEKPMLKWATAIHSLGRSEITGLNSFYLNQKSWLIPYGYTPEIVDPPTRASEKDRFIIGFCGRLDIYTKGLDLLLAAFAEMSKHIPNAELWIIGDGAQKNQLIKNMLQYELGKTVYFTGSKFGAEKTHLLQQLHVFAHPSRNEGLPAAILEAASLGIPCLVTEATNTGEAIRQYEAGEVVAGYTTTALFEAGIKLHQRILTEGWEPMSRRARKMVAMEYNWQKIIPQFDQLYASH
jgi:glycosyltransferase involved in cell wall biosynthesis